MFSWGFLPNFDARGGKISPKFKMGGEGDKQTPGQTPDGGDNFFWNFGGGKLIFPASSYIVAHVWIQLNSVSFLLQICKKKILFAWVYVICVRFQHSSLKCLHYDDVSFNVFP